MSSAPGSRLGPYEIVAPLGAGGMGEVYRATDRRLDREVAVKVLPAEISDDPDALARFEREAKAIAALSHPNVLSIYDIGREQGVSFVVTELLEGETLRALLEPGALPLRKAVDYAAQLADGLAAAHARGVVHRDLKPENVIVTRDGRVKLLDFGLARMGVSHGSADEAETRLDATKPHTVLGTVGYMSPEQVRGGRADARSDLFAFGALLYELLTGRRAFDAGSSAETMSAVLRDDPPASPPGEVPIPSRLERIVRRCLEKSPDERFQSARDLAFALTTTLDDTETQDAPATAPPPAASAEISVVVLPFANLSANPDDEFLADGFMEEAISDLSAIKSLKVISRTSAIRLKGADKDAATIATDLGVRYVLEGSVQRSGDALRVTARLIDAHADLQVWTDRHSGTRSDIFSIQEQVARGIVEALRVRLTPQEDRALSIREVSDPRAYESYLRARSALWSFDADSFRVAQRHLEHALAIVGDNPLLLAALGQVHASYGLAGAPPALDRAQTCVDRILVLHPDSPHAVWLRGLVAYSAGDLRRALPDLEEAHRRLPDDPDVMVMLVASLLNRDQDERVEALCARLLEIDPLTPVNQAMPGMVHIMAGRPDQALPLYRRFLEMDPDNPLALMTNSWLLLQCGRIAEATPFVERLEAVNPTSPYLSLARALLLGARGERDRALSAISPEVVALAEHGEHWSRMLTQCYAVAGRVDEALRWLENTFRMGTVHYPYWSRHDPLVASLRTDQRFHALMDRVRAEWVQGVSPERAAAYPPLPAPASTAGGAAVSSGDTDPAAGMDAAASPEASIAVLPFTNMSADPGNEYFSDGMTEEIINALANVPSLRVIARTSAFAFKDTSVDVREIGRKLGVGTVLEGSVRRAGGRLRITAQLIDASDGHHLWSDRYDRDADDVFAVQDEISQIIADRLRTGAEAPAASRERATDNLEAYEAYLRGRFFYAKGTPDQYATSVEHFERATTLDPRFAQAHTGLAETLFFWSVVAPEPMQFMRRAKASAETALAADDTLSEGHAILGLLEFFGDWNWHGATERLERALQLNPNSANAHQIYAIVMTNLGRPALAVSHSRHGVSLDPLSAQMMQTLQFTLHQVGEYGESMEFAERALEIAPDYLLTHNTLGFTFVALDRLDDAERAFRKVLSIAPHEPQARAGLAKVFAKDGRREEAQQCVRELERLAEAGLGQVATCTAFAHAEIDNIDQAFAWVERAIVRHEQWMVCLPTFGWWDPMRRDPRFEPLLRRLNFPEWSIAYSAERARTVQ